VSISKSEIKTVSISSIEANPWRMKHRYPLKPDAVDALVRSIKEVGLWEGIIVRKKGRGYEMAFGHHRLAAAKKCKLARIPVIVRDLDDEQMLQFMGRENGEDYNTDFLRLLNTWEAAVSFLGRPVGPILQQSEIANLLGWVRSKAGRGIAPNDTANACHAALTLIEAGHLDRNDLDGLSVKAAREIVQRVLARHEQIEQIAKTTGRSPKEQETAKRQVSKAAKSTAKSVKSGDVRKKDIKSEIDYRTHVAAQKDKGPRSIAADIAFRELANQIERMLNNDSASGKLDQIEAALSMIREDSEATQALGRVAFELKMLRQRTHEREQAIRKAPKSRKGAKIIPLRAIAGGE